jgi:hypothetical protein
MVTLIAIIVIVWLLIAMVCIGNDEVGMVLLFPITLVTFVIIALIIYHHNVGHF